MPRDLRDKSIVITGASSGIGADTAVACAAAGMDVVLGARREDKLEAVAKRVRDHGRRAVVVRCDVTRDQDVQALFDQAWNELGRVDALFANAGFGLVYPLLETPADRHREIFEVNYWGTLRTLDVGVPLLEKTEGGLKHALICSSAASEIGMPRHGPYAATKAAQDAIASALRAELHDRGVAVTSVHPVGTKTDFFDTAAERSDRDQRETNTPPGLMQSGEHVARTVVRALRKPTPEVWPSVPARLGLALCTALPGFAAWVMRRHHRELIQNTRER
ncbi:MAG: SDR family NAD(P)-dependent oxidoreductase [Phycisphaeraceae bacterium]